MSIIYPPNLIKSRFYIFYIYFVFELNLFKRVNLRVGETYLQQPGTPDKNLLKQLMTNLALTLPESRRGEYSK